MRVTVLDREGVASGSSWGNAGMLNPAFTVPLPEPSVLRYGIASLFDRDSPVSVPPAVDRHLWAFLLSFARNCTARRWRRTMAVFNELNRGCLAAYEQLVEGGVHAPVKDADPLVIACRNQQDRAHVLEEFAHMSATGGDEARFEAVSGAELRALEPVLSDEVRLGLKVHGQRFINPPAFLDTLAEDVRSRGGDIVEGCSVARIRDRGRSGVELVPSPSSAVAEPVRADAVVLACGAWLDALARPFGVRMRVQAGRGYSFTVRPRAMPTHPIYLSGQRIACNPLGDRFRVTGTMESRARPTRRSTRGGCAPSSSPPGRCSATWTGRTAARSGWDPGRAPRTGCRWSGRAARPGCRSPAGTVCGAWCSDRSPGGCSPTP